MRPSREDIEQLFKTKDTWQHAVCCVLSTQCCSVLSVCRTTGLYLNKLSHPSCVHLLAAGMLAEDGRCKTLDMSADGYVRAEAAAAVIMVLSSSVSGSQLQGCAVLAATAVNQDGR